MSWDSAKFKDVFFIHGGNPSPKEGEFDEEGIPFVKMKDLGAYHHTTGLSETENKVSSKTIKSKRLKIIPKGSILIPRSGSVAQNHRAVLSQDSAIVSHICALEVKDKTRLFNLFAYYYLTTIDMVKITKKTTGLDAITFEDLAELEIPLPPLPIQKRIAEILDAADALRKKDQELLKKYDELAQAIFIDMFGDPVKNEKGLKSQKLNSCLAAGESISYGIVQPGSEVVNGIPVIRVGDFESMSINKKNVKKVEKDIEAKHKRTRLIGDEILIACVGSIGKIALADESLKGYNIVRATARVRVDTSKLNRKYLAVFLSQKSIQDYFNSETRTVSQPTLNIKQIEETLVLIPSLKDQISFEKHYDALQTMKSKLLIKMGENLFESLLQKAFSGKLVS